MPIEKTIKLYAYHELSEPAKERAREWYFSTLYWPEELEPTIDHWREIAEKLGFEIYRNGGPWWDLYRRYFKIGRGSFLRPEEDELDTLERAYKPHPETGWEGNPDVLSLIATVRAIRPDMSARIEEGKVYDVDGGRHHVEEPDVDYPDEEWDIYDEQVEAINKEEKINIEDALSELQYLGLKWLQSAADYIESEEVIEEAMEANEWLFHEDGTYARY